MNRPLQIRRVSTAVDVRARRTHYVLNVRLLAVTGLALVLLAVGLVVWVKVQKRRHAGVLFERATAAMEAQDWKTAEDYLTHYVAYRPDDAEARILLAQLMDETAETSRGLQAACRLYSLALGLVPERQDIRRRLAALQLQLERYQAALTQADRLLEIDPQDAEALRVKALSMLALSKTTSIPSIAESINLLQIAVAANPQDIELTQTLAAAYLADEYATDEIAALAAADAVFDQLVAANSDDASAWLARHQHRRELQEEGADYDIREALELAPDSLPVLLAAADWEQQQEEMDAAHSHLQHAIETSPYDARGYLALGRLTWNQGDLPAALDIWQQGLRKVGSDDFRLNYQLASAWIASGELDQAREQLSHLQRLFQDHLAAISRPQQLRLRAGLLFLEARLHAARGNYALAIDRLREVLASHEGSGEGETVGTSMASVAILLGNCHAGLEEWELAAAAFEQAARWLPHDSLTRMAASEAWCQVENWPLSIRRLEQVAEMPEPPALVYLALASSRFQQQVLLPANEPDWRKCEQALAAAAEADPGNADVLMLRCAVDIEQGHPELAWQRLRAAETQRAEVLSKLRIQLESHQTEATPEELRTSALLLSTGDSDDCREAWRIMQPLVANPDAAPADRRIVAMLLDRCGDASEKRLAVSLLAPLLNETASPQESTLQNSNLPNWGDVFLLAELQQSLGEIDEVEALLARASEHDDAPPELVSAYTQLLLKHRTVEQAASWFQHWESQASAEVAYTTFASWLNEHQDPTDTNQVLGTWLAAAQEHPSSLMCVLIATMLTHRDAATPDEIAQAEELISSALQEFPTFTPLLFSVATWRQVCGENLSARRLLERLLEIDPENVAAMNNLALLLATELEEPETALPLIENAIRSAGPRPELLDTQALVLLSLERPSEAVSLLKPLVEPSDGLAGARWHLAAALVQQQEFAAAREVLGDLPNESDAALPLTPYERRLREKLREVLR